MKAVMVTTAQIMKPKVMGGIFMMFLGNMIISLAKACSTIGLQPEWLPHHKP
jgi:hypothetical protein